MSIIDQYTTGKGRNTQATTDPTSKFRKEDSSLVLGTVLDVNASVGRARVSVEGAEEPVDISWVSPGFSPQGVGVFWTPRVDDTVLLGCCRDGTWLILGCVPLRATNEGTSAHLGAGLVTGTDQTRSVSPNTGGTLPGSMGGGIEAPIAQGSRGIMGNTTARQSTARDVLPGDYLVTADDGTTLFGVLEGGLIMARASWMASLTLNEFDDNVRLTSGSFDWYSNWGHVQIVPARYFKKPKVFSNNVPTNPLSLQDPKDSERITYMERFADTAGAARQQAFQGVIQKGATYDQNSLVHYEVGNEDGQPRSITNWYKSGKVQVESVGGFEVDVTSTAPGVKASVHDLRQRNRWDTVFQIGNTTKSASTLNNIPLVFIKNTNLSEVQIARTGRFDVKNIDEVSFRVTPTANDVSFVTDELSATAATAGITAGILDTDLPQAVFQIGSCSDSATGEILRQHLRVIDSDTLLSGSYTTAEQDVFEDGTFRVKTYEAYTTDGTDPVAHFVETASAHTAAAKAAGGRGFSNILQGHLQINPDGGLTYDNYDASGGVTSAFNTQKRAHLGISTSGDYLYNNFDVPGNKMSILSMSSTSPVHLGSIENSSISALPGSVSGLSMWAGQGDLSVSGGIFFSPDGAILIKNYRGAYIEVSALGKITIQSKNGQIVDINPATP